MGVALVVVAVAVAVADGGLCNARSKAGGGGGGALHAADAPLKGVGSGMIADLGLGPDKAADPDNAPREGVRITACWCWCWCWGWGWLAEVCDCD